ncbi:adrenodoxin-like protein 2, mitochondrial [Dioscorea cayenensis subsp. rotundata]|uniref:Adrenodoxin-like protein 2, mitochondrial n=1 Tax=Dioscorea cayennensis subsp. rotundata TaxID=55577 RepID=A0AB40AWX0_DIOCR|nr:adrenodoxin-like protein 2, mitochondrial [Dioscorea cayenensis subsp. rotundata]
MLLSRLSRLGARITGEACRGKFSNTQRGYYEGTLNNYLYYLRNRTLSTTSSDNAQEGCEQQTEKISVTFVDKDGEEKLIKVPVGMSMLEAAHENDIELEGDYFFMLHR